MSVTRKTADRVAAAGMGVCVVGFVFDSSILPLLGLWITWTVVMLYSDGAVR